MNPSVVFIRRAIKEWYESFTTIVIDELYRGIFQIIFHIKEYGLTAKIASEMRVALHHR